MSLPTTNFFSLANPGFITTTSGSILSGAATIPLNTVSGLTNASIFVGIIEPGGTKQQVFTGVVDTSGLQLTSVVWIEGSNVDHGAGVSIVDYVSDAHHNMTTTGILKEHNQDGSHIAGNDGYTKANETWTYASATTITVPSDATLKYQKGDRIKLTQSTVKYFYVTAVAATTLTINGGSDYTLTNAAISANYYSHALSPVGFPHSFTYAETWTGFTATVPSAGGGVRFCIMGNLVRVDINRSTAGTSNATTCYVSLPIVGRASTTRVQGFIGIMDNGVQSQGFYTNDATSSATDMHFYKDITGAVFTNTGSKNIYGSFWYEI